MTKKETYNVALIIGSVRTQRWGIHVANWMKKHLEDAGMTVTVVDPLETPLPLVGDRYSDFEPGTAPAVLKKIHQTLTDADGFVLISPEYNHGISGALKNVFDTFYREEFGYKPALITSYSNGNYAGVRVTEQLRQITVELGMTPVAAGVAISNVDTTFVNGTLEASVKDRYEKQVNKALAIFRWYLEALKQQREKGLPE